MISKSESVTEKKAEINPVIKIAKYSFSDEDSKVKIYIELNQFKNPISKDMIEINFQELSLAVRIVDEQSNEYALSLTKLYEKIEPEKCSWRWTEKKITITLVKWLETKWSTLTKGK